jgi:hypothetical protein
MFSGYADPEEQYSQNCWTHKVAAVLWCGIVDEIASEVDSLEAGVIVFVLGLKHT